jgi:hypothetical protein
MGVTAGIALAVSAASTAASLSASGKAKKAQERANAAQMKANRLKNLQQKRQFMRGFRQAQANVLSTSIASGIGLGSSRTQGTLGSESSQQRLALREFQQFDELGVEVANQQNKAASAQFRSQAFGAVANFSSQFVSFGGGGPGDKIPNTTGEQALGGTGSGN